MAARKRGTTATATATGWALSWIVAMSCLLSTALAFPSLVASIPRSRLFQSSSSSSSEGNGNGKGVRSLEDLFADSSLWGTMKDALNAVPAFACANEQGQPLQYDVGTGPIGFFFLDVEAAQEKLQKAQNELQEGNVNDKLALVPFPLGEVFEMAARGASEKNMNALIIPSQRAIETAGAPKGMDPLGQQVPLFGCMDLVEQRGQGQAGVVPLFFHKDEADQAMNTALQSMQEQQDKQQFQVTVLPLAGAVQMQATSNEQKAFAFVPPKASLDYF